MKNLTIQSDDGYETKILFTGTIDQCLRFDRNNLDNRFLSICHGTEMLYWSEGRDWIKNNKDWTVQNPKTAMNIALSVLKTEVNLDDNDPNYYDLEIEIGNVYLNIQSDDNWVSVTSCIDSMQVCGYRKQIAEYLQKLDVIDLSNMVELADEMGL